MRPHMEIKQSDIIVKKETLIVFSCFPSRNGKHIAFIVRRCFLNIECVTFYTLSCHRIFESEVGGESSSSPTFITQGGISSASSLTESQTASASKACRDKDRSSTEILFLNRVTFWGTGGLGFQHMNLTCNDNQIYRLMNSDSEEVT